MLVHGKNIKITISSEDVKFLLSLHKLFQTCPTFFKLEEKI